jgi:glycerophosphoryl diester phosphodiesterase
LAKSTNAIDKIAFNEVNCEYLIEAKRLNSSVPVFWDRLPNSDLENDIYIAKQFNFNSLMFVEEALNIEKVARLQRENIVCGACVVNDENQMDKFLSWGIEFYYTDFPKKLLLKK